MKIIKRIFQGQEKALEKDLQEKLLIQRSSSHYLRGK